MTSTASGCAAASTTYKDVATPCEEISHCTVCAEAASSVRNAPQLGSRSLAVSTSSRRTGSSSTEAPGRRHISINHIKLRRTREQAPHVVFVTTCGELLPRSAVAMHEPVASISFNGLAKRFTARHILSNGCMSVIDCRIFCTCLCVGGGARLRFRSACRSVAQVIPVAHVKAVMNNLRCRAAV